jgi:hypothetical protein
MTTQKQVEANRKNAKLGGVKTDAGKEVSKYNAMKHGILSKEILIDGEDEQILIELGKKLRVQLAPEGELEMILVDRIISNVWRLKRLLKIEKSSMEWSRADTLYDSIEFGTKTEGQLELKAERDMVTCYAIPLILRYETTIERSFIKALHELQRIQSARKGEGSQIPIAVDIEADG